MKKQIIILSIMAAGLAHAQMFAQMFCNRESAWTPAELSPVAWYCAENNALDSSGNSYTATWSGSVAYATGKVGNAFELDGSTDYLTIPTNAANVISGQQFTLAMWIRPDQDFNSLGGGTRYEQQFLRDCVSVGDPGNVNSWIWKIDADTDRIQFSVFNGASALSVNVFGDNTTWEASTWYHIALVFDGAGYTHYLNGNPDGYTADSDTVSATTGHLILVGRDPNPSPNSQMFDGLIDDVLVLGSAKSAAQILMLYNGSTGKGGVAW